MRPRNSQMRFWAFRNLRSCVDPGRYSFMGELKLFNPCWRWKDSYLVEWRADDLPAGCEAVGRRPARSPEASFEEVIRLS